MSARVFVLLLCLLTLGLRAQPVSSVVVINTEQGLSQGMVFDILQSRDGYLWIATKDGLNRYDGYRFEVYAPDTFDPFSIGSGEIRRVHEDSQGRLWLAYEGGIDVFVPTTGRFYHLPLSPEFEFSGYTEAFAEAPDGAMWITNNGILFQIELREPLHGPSENPFPTFVCTKVETPPVHRDADFRWNSVFFFKNKVLYAATSAGLYRMDAAARQLGAKPELVADSDLKIIGDDGQGHLWLKSNDTLLVWNPAKTSAKKIPATVYSLWRFDAAGNLWELADGTLRQWRPDALLAGGSPEMDVRLFRQNAAAYYLTAACPDRSGNAWVGTSGYGLLKAVAARPKFSSYLPLTSQRAIIETPEGGFFTMQNPQGLYPDSRFDRAVPNPWFSTFPKGKTACMAAFDQRGDCWVRCCEGDLFRIDAQTKAPKRLEDGGTGLLLDRQGRVLSLSERALHVLDTKTGKSVAHDLPDGLRSGFYVENYLKLLAEDRQGVVWIMAFEGLLKAVPTDAGYRFERFVNNPRDRASLSNNRVLCVAEDPRDPDRYLWIGTKGGGLNRLDRQTGRMTHYQTEQGLPDNVVYGILPDRAGNLWLSTNKGLCRMTLGHQDGLPQFKNFTVADGLQSNEFNQASFLKARDGTVLFGGINGISVFHPDSLGFNAHLPPVHIVGMRINNEKWLLPFSAPLALSHRQNVVALDFAALDFTNPAQNQFRYQLLQQRFWGQSRADTLELGTQHSIQFANLPPGRYTFRVWGSNNDGIWNPEPAVLEFEIHPPWWASWWAYLAYFLLFAAAFAAFNQYRLRQRLAQQEALRLRELDEFKNRFFTNITHEFRTPLTVILGMAERLESDPSDRVTSSHPVTKGGKSSPATLIKRSAQNLLRLINQILDLAKLENNTLRMNYVQGDVLPYLRYITESLHSLAEAQGVALRVESREPEISMDYDPERLLQIVHNLLSNAIKFTPAGGEVVLRVERERDLPGFQNLEGLLVLRVSDTGAGIPPDDLPYIFDRFYQAKNLEKAKAGGTGIGLALTRELVQVMGGDISVQSTVGKGTTFSVRLPITNKSERWAVGGGADGVPPTERPLPTDGTLSTAHRLQPTDDRPLLLLIEDNPDVMEYLAACLGAYYQLDFAPNGRIGIEKAIETVPDLIVSDVMMPEKDGFEVCDFLKNDERSSHIPIVLLTAKADVESRIAGLRRGADAYLAKPFHEQELLVTVANLLELRKKLQAKYSRSILEPAQPLTAHPSPTHPSPAHPSSAHPLTPDPEDAFLQKIRALVEHNLADSDFDMPHLERMLAMSRSQIFRKMKALTGRSPSQFIRSIRLHHGRRLLQTTELTVSEIAYEVGFSSVKYFSDAFVEEFGERPSGVRG